MLNSAADTSSEEFRHQAETRHVAALPTDAARRLYLQGVHEKRGEAAWKRLRADVWKLLREVAA